MPKPAPRTPIQITLPRKGSAAPRALTAAKAPASSPAPQALVTALGTLPAKERSEHGALTVRPGAKRKAKLEALSKQTGHSMQVILLHCFDLAFPD